jgi:hypothetical protein
MREASYQLPWCCTLPPALLGGIWATVIRLWRTLRLSPLRYIVDSSALVRSIQLRCLWFDSCPAAGTEQNQEQNARTGGNLQGKRHRRWWIFDGIRSTGRCRAARPPPRAAAWSPPASPSRLLLTRRLASSVSRVRSRGRDTGNGFGRQVGLRKKARYYV